MKTNSLLSFVLLFGHFFITNATQLSGQESEVYGSLRADWSNLSNIVRFDKELDLLDTLYLSPDIHDYVYDAQNQTIHFWDRINSNLGSLNIQESRKIIHSEDLDLEDVEWDLEDNLVFRCDYTSISSTNMEGDDEKNLVDLIYGDHVMSIDQDLNIITIYSDQFQPDSLWNYRFIRTYDYEGELLGEWIWENRQRPTKIVKVDSAIIYITDNLGFLSIYDLDNKSYRDISQLYTHDIAHDYVNNKILLSSRVNPIDIDSSKMVAYDWKKDSLVDIKRCIGYEFLNIQTVPGDNSFYYNSRENRISMLNMYDMGQDTNIWIYQNPTFEILALNFDESNQQLSWVARVHNFLSNSGVKYCELESSDVITCQNLEWGNAGLTRAFLDDSSQYVLAQDTLYFFNAGSLTSKMKISPPISPREQIQFDIEGELIYRIKSGSDWVDVYNFSGQFIRSFGSTSPSRALSSALSPQLGAIAVSTINNEIVIEPLNQEFKAFTIEERNGLRMNLLVFDPINPYLYYWTSHQLNRVNIHNREREVFFLLNSRSSSSFRYYVHTPLNVSTSSWHKVDKSVDVFPNPSSGFITISADTEIKKIVVYDELGRALESYDSFGQNQMTINLKPESGQRILHIKTDVGVAVVPLIIGD